MALFIGVHKMPGAIQEQVNENWKKYKDSCTSAGIQALKAHYNLVKGVGYCYTEADSEEQVKEAHEVVDIPLEEIIEVQTID